MRRVAIVTKYEVMQQHLMGGTEENQNLIQGSHSPGRVLNRDLPNTNKVPLTLDPDVQNLPCMFIIQAVNLLQQ